MGKLDTLRAQNIIKNVKIIEVTHSNRLATALALTSLLYLRGLTAHDVKKYMVRIQE
jgi:hypothetical protein